MSSTVTWIVQGTQRSRHCLHKVPKLNGGVLRTSQILSFLKALQIPFAVLPHISTCHLYSN